MTVHVAGRVSRESPGRQIEKLRGTIGKSDAAGTGGIDGRGNTAVFRPGTVSRNEAAWASERLSNSYKVQSLIRGRMARVLHHPGREDGMNSGNET